MSDKDFQQVVRYSYNESANSLAVDGYLIGAIGRKVVRTLVNPTTERYTFMEGTDTKFVLEIVYVDATRGDIVSAERIS